jgi:hypothetical protein
MVKRSKQPTAKVALTYNRQRRDNEALWTRIQGHAGIYQVQRAAERAHRVELGNTQPVCDCDTYRLRVASQRPGKGAACPHIAALRDCGFLAACA